MQQTTTPKNVDKKALMAMMLKRKGIVAPQQITITRSANGGPLPLSKAQERIWNLYSLNPTSSAYHLQTARRIIGRLKPRLLAEALNTIAGRHHILSSAFPELDGQAKQLRLPDFIFPLTTLDLSSQPQAKKAAAVRQAMIAFVEKPFDLEKGPLVRALLLQESAENHILLAVFHQIVFDGSSAGIFLQELTSLYDALAAGQTADLPPLSIQYADYTLWQLENTGPEQAAAQGSYWKDKLSQPYQPLALPADRPRPARESFAGRAIDFTLPAELGQALKQYSQGQGKTLFATLLAAFKALLYLYSRQEDVLVFTSAEGRVQPQLKPVIGLFGRQLPLRTDLSERPTFNTLLSRVGQVLQEAIANQDVPFSELVDMIKLKNGYSPSALFQAMFIFVSEQQTSLSRSGLQMEPFQVEKQVAKFDWRLLMLEQEDVLYSQLEYKPELFDEATAAQIPAHFEALLRAIVEDPEREIGELVSLPDHWHGRSSTSQNQAPVKKAYESPRDRAELEMCQIWEKTLGISPIGIFDDFFELGGHSLTAVSLMARIEERTGRKLPLTTLFQASTIEKMAALIRDEGWEKYESALIPIKPGGSQRPLFFVPPAGTTVLKYAFIVPQLGEDQPFYGLQPAGLEEGETPHRTVEDMAAFYLKAIQAFQPEGPYLLGGQCFGGLVAFEMARRLEQQGQAVGLVAIIDTELPPKRPSHLPEPENRVKVKPARGQKSSSPSKALSLDFIRKAYNRFSATWIWAHKNPLYLLQNLTIWRRYSLTRKAHVAARLSYTVSEPYPGPISFLQFSTSDHTPRNSLWQWTELAGGGIDIEAIDGSDEARANGDFDKQFGQWLTAHLEAAHQKDPA